MYAGSGDESVARSGRGGGHTARGVRAAFPTYLRPAPLGACSVATMLLKRQNGWRSDAFKVYVRNIGVGAGMVPGALMAVKAKGYRLPGHGIV